MMVRGAVMPQYGVEHRTRSAGCGASECGKSGSEYTMGADDCAQVVCLILCV